MNNIINKTINKKRMSFSMSFLGTLTLIFIFCKLTGSITWSWWWVLSPLWLGWLIIISIIGLVTMICLLIFGGIYCYEEIQIYLFRRRKK